MRKLFVYALVAGLAPTRCVAQVNVTFAPGTPASLQQDFIQSTTGFYLSTVSKSLFFSNTYTLTISSHNPDYQPPAISSPIYTNTAFQECIVYGFSNGQDYERLDNVRVITGLKDFLLVDKTCGGTISSVDGCAQTYLDGCMTGYNVAISTITQKN